MPEDEDLYPPDLMDDFKAWLADQPECKAAAETSGRDFADDGTAQTWLDQQSEAIERKRDEIAHDPHALAIAGILAPYLADEKLNPTANAALDNMTEFLESIGGDAMEIDDTMREALSGSLNLDSAHFRIYAAGNTIVVCEGTAIASTNPRADLPRLAAREIEALKPHIFALREEHAAVAQGRGLWSSASMTVSKAGRVDIVPTPDHEFAIGYDNFTDADFASDQQRFPRKKPAPWLKEKINRGQ